MKMLQGAALAAAMALGCLTAGSVQAQVADRVYDAGPTWAISYIETKPAKLNAYMAYLAGPWRQIQEAGKKRGDVLDYKVVQVHSVRDHEPNLILMIQYKNMAVYDRSLADIDKENAAIFGSLAASNQSQVVREDIRIARGGVVGRELKFIK